MLLKRAWVTGFGLALLSACPQPKVEDSGDTATGPECPDSLESFCAYEFGGACPTYDQVITMSCDGYHFTSGSGSAISEYEGCANNLGVDCHTVAADRTMEFGTLLQFNFETYELEYVSLYWGEECGLDDYNFGSMDC